MRIKYFFRQRKIFKIVAPGLVLFLFILGLAMIIKPNEVKGFTIGSGQTETWDGSKTYDNVTIQAGGVLTHSSNNGQSGFDLVVTNELLIEGESGDTPGGKIDVSAKGYPGGNVKCGIIAGTNTYIYKIKSAGGSDVGEGRDFPGFDWAGRGGNWFTGGTGGGGAYITLNRGGAGGGGSGAYGYGSGGKTNIPTSGIGNYGGGGAGWEGEGGAGASSANGENGATCLELNIPCSDYGNQRLFGGGGGAGTPNFPSAVPEGWCPEVEPLPDEGGYVDYDLSGSTMSNVFYGGPGGGAAKIKANKLVIESGGLISANGQAGNAPYYLSERDGLGAGGGGGTIYIEVDDLEISGYSRPIISARGGNGQTLLWGSDYSTSGAGGGGIVYIKVNNSVKIDGVYYDTSTNWIDNLKAKLNVSGGTTLTSNTATLGGNGIKILAGNPQIPSAQCDLANIKFKETKFVSGIPDKVDQGQELAVDLKYTLSNDQPAECTEKFYLHFGLPADWTYVSSNLDGFGSATPSGVTSRYYWDLGQIGQSGDRTYNPSFVAKAPTNSCPAGNQFLIWQSYGTGPDTSFKTSDMVYSKNFSVNCPGLSVTGDVGAVGNVEGITVLGNSVVTRAGGAYSAGSGVTDLAGYSHSIDFSQIEARFAALKQERAKPFSAIVSGQLNPDNKPEGGVWTLTSGALSGNYTGSATIFRDGNLTIDNLRVTGGVLGIVVSGGAVDIKDNQLNNVAIYVYGSNAKIVFKNSLNSASIYGAFIAQSIDIEPQATGNVSYDADLVKYPPPPGFSQILSQIQLLEAVP